MLTRLLLSFLLLAGIRAGAQTNLYVDSSAAVSGSGASWAAAYKTLNEALNVANPASTTVKYIINVAKGTYYPTGVQSGTDRDSAFGIFRGGIKIFGGYPNGGGVRNVSAYPAILSGNIGSATVTADNSYHIMVVSNISAASDSMILDGLTFTGGNANVYSSKPYNGLTIVSASGGGIYQTYVNNPGLINNCSFYNNTAAIYEGGAMFNTSAKATITNCNFTNNSAPSGSGGGISNQVYIPTISSCSFIGNTALYGGALNNSGSTGSGFGAGISYCTFTGNMAITTGNNQGLGGAIYDNSGSSFVPIIYCSFSGNHSNSSGGAVYSTASNNGTYMNHCSFSGNTSTIGGAVYSSAYALIINSSFIGNRATNMGGGAYGGEFTQCIFTNDTAVYGGGAV